MSSDSMAISVDRISKCFHLYERAEHRLAQLVVPTIRKALPNGLARWIGRDVYHREFWALRDVSIKVAKGEAVGIIGRNGSGKSTLLQIIAGTTQPTRGRVAVAGRVAALLELGSGFNPEFSGRENIYLNGSILGLSRADMDERLDAILEFADIGAFIDDPVRTYSSGMFLRLAFAVQVQINPDILIIDEALAVGDALFQKRCFQRMEELRAAGTTLLFVSHDQETVRTMTDRAILLRGGQIAMEGSSSDVILQYRKDLHEDESRYFSAVANRLEKTTPQSVPPASPPTALKPECGSLTAIDAKDLTFGAAEAEVFSIEILNEKGISESVFYPGDRVTIRLGCRIFRTISNLAVGLRIRNKEGLKIYSWGTLNQDISIRAGIRKGEIFWEKKFESGAEFFVEFNFTCTLGVNLYEVQTAITHEMTFDYKAQRILQWRDQAAFFQILMRQDEYWFGGAADLMMTAALHQTVDVAGVAESMGG